jgi:hypothetical protein
LCPAFSLFVYICVDGVGMRDIVYILGIILGVGFAFKVGKIEGIQSVPAPVPIAVNLENQCVAWFFQADLKAAKKHICGNRK